MAYFVVRATNGNFPYNLMIKLYFWIISNSLRIFKAANLVGFSNRETEKRMTEVKSSKQYFCIFVRA